MKIISVLILCALFACTKSPADRSVGPVANPEPPISNPLQVTEGDSLLVEASVVEYSEGIISRWKVEVYMSRIVEEPVSVTVEWNGPLGPVSFNATLEPAEREHRFITEFTTPIDSSPENVRITNVSCGIPELTFRY